MRKKIALVVLALLIGAAFLFVPSTGWTRSGHHYRHHGHSSYPRHRAYRHHGHSSYPRHRAYRPYRRHHKHDHYRHHDYSSPSYRTYRHWY